MYFTLTPKRWANLLYYREQIDNEVKALDCKLCPVDFHVHIGDGYFVTIEDGWNYVHMFYYDMRVPYVKPLCEDVGYCDGISLRFNEWTRLLELTPAVHKQYPELANKQSMHEDDNDDDCDEVTTQLMQLYMSHSDC